MSQKELKTISDYVNELSSIHNNVAKKAIEQILKGVFIAIKDDIQKGNDVRINNFGTFKLKTRPARKGRNPQTGETIDIEEKQVITFKPTKASK